MHLWLLFLAIASATARPPLEPDGVSCCGLDTEFILDVSFVVTGVPKFYSADNWDTLEDLDRSESYGQTTD